MLKPFSVLGRRIGDKNEPFLIAEMSGNHNKSLDRALQIVDAAAKAGAHALKIQTYTADTMTLDIDEREFRISDKKSLWKGASLYSLYKSAYTPWEWHKAIFKRCKERGMVGFSTPFDATSVDFLETLHVPMYKIASFENTDIPLIVKVAKTGKPLIISTGMAQLSELTESVRAARANGCKNIVLLKCTSAYPTPPQHCNLMTIPDLVRRFHCHVGVSDHTIGIGVSLAAAALGASVIERHLTLSRKDGGVDSAFSLEPQEFLQLVRESKNVAQSIGKPSYGAVGDEKKSVQFRRSLYFVEDINKGDIITTTNVRSIRPGLGLPPKYLASLIGKRVRKSIRRGTPVKSSHVQ